VPRIEIQLQVLLLDRKRNLEEAESQRNDFQCGLVDVGELTEGHLATSKRLKRNHSDAKQAVTQVEEVLVQAAAAAAHYQSAAAKLKEILDAGKLLCGSGQ
jgi:hypothetical protein